MTNAPRGMGTVIGLAPNDRSAGGLDRLSGSGDWIRTGDTSGMNRMLWPTELRRHKSGPRMPDRSGKG